MRNKTLHLLFQGTFWSAMIALVGFMTSFWVFEHLPIEWSSSALKDGFEAARFFGIPICILLTLFGTIRPRDTSDRIAVKAIFTSIIAGISFFVLVGTIFDGMCEWTTRQVLFEHVQDASHQIVVRDMGCGAVDSGTPLVAVFEVQEITSFFLQVDRIDTTQIDLLEWYRKAL